MIQKTALQLFSLSLPLRQQRKMVINWIQTHPPWTLLLLPGACSASSSLSLPAGLTLSYSLFKFSLLSQFSVLFPNPHRALKLSLWSLLFPVLKRSRSKITVASLFLSFHVRSHAGLIIKFKFLKLSIVPTVWSIFSSGYSEMNHQKLVNGEN